MERMIMRIPCPSRPLNLSLFRNSHLINTMGCEEFSPENSNYSKVSIYGPLIQTSASAIGWRSSFSRKWNERCWKRRRRWCACLEVTENLSCECMSRSCTASSKASTTVSICMTSKDRGNQIPRKRGRFRGAYTGIFYGIYMSPRNYLEAYWSS